MSSPRKQVPNFSLPFCSESSTTSIDSVQPHPRPLRPNPPSPKSITTSSKSPQCWRDDTNDLVLARCALLEERSGDPRSLEIRNRMEESSGKLLQALPSRSAAENHKELDSVYFLRNQQRTRVGEEHRNIHFLPLEPTELLRKMLREQVIERRRLQRQVEEGKGRPRRAMNTLRAFMLKGNKQAEAEYFQRREEREHAKRQNAQKSSERKAVWTDSPTC
jgi:hypothetical protein